MNPIRAGGLICCAVAMCGWLVPGFHAVALGFAQESASSAAVLEQRLAAYRRLLSDWGGLTKYGSEDSELKPPAPGENRVVLIGDQITEFWGRGGAGFFSGRP